MIRSNETTSRRTRNDPFFLLVQLQLVPAALVVAACRGATSEPNATLPAWSSTIESSGKRPVEDLKLEPSTESSVEASPIPRPTNPEVLSFVETLEHARDPAHWAVLTKQKPVHGFVSIAREAPEIEISSFDSVTVHDVGHDRWNSQTGWGLNSFVEGCLTAAVTSDGELCPSVVLPGKELSADLGERFLELFKENNPNIVTMCGFPPPTIVLVYRKADVPVGVLSFDTNCGKWSSFPGPFGQTIAPNITDRLWELCREGDLPLCRHRDDPVRKEAWAYYKQTISWQTRENQAFLLGYEGRLAPRPLKQDIKQRLDELDEAERLELCVWNTEHVIDDFSPTFKDHQDWSGFSFPGVSGTRETRGLPFNECVERFPKTCTHTVEEVLPCMDTAQRGDATFALAEHASCRPLAHCLWGLESRIDYSPPVEPL